MGVVVLRPSTHQSSVSTEALVFCHLGKGPKDRRVVTYKDGGQRVTLENVVLKNHEMFQWSSVLWSGID